MHTFAVCDWKKMTDCFRVISDPQVILKEILRLKTKKELKYSCTGKKNKTKQKTRTPSSQKIKKKQV